jgi:hypothetical protein
MNLTIPSPFGTLNCTTNNTDIGVLTGVSSGTAIMDVNGVFNCGAILPSVKWEGIYSVTTPAGLGVVA